MLQAILPFKEFSLPREPIRRRVYRVCLDPLPDGTYVFKAKSFSRRCGPSYKCHVNPRTGFVFCTCRDFQYRRGRWMPTYEHGPFCKHLRRAVRTVKKLVKRAALEGARAA